jgi:hypothetical protein
VVAKLEALRTSAARLRDLVLDVADGLSSLTVSLSTAVEQLEGQVDAVANNGVHFGNQSTFVAILSHFLELDAVLELFGYRLNVNLTEDQVDTFWTWVCSASDSLLSHIFPLVAHTPPDGARE